MVFLYQSQLTIWHTPEIVAFKKHVSESLKAKDEPVQHSQILSQQCKLKNRQESQREKSRVLAAVYILAVHKCL